uniref:uncharacterized protein LOC105350893 n=1 Tax=Fragaria vesca subsp. vesca TaxID=101020 RepID=UPI0005CB5375|nr:PREDICTED: uncharacterized protein LOC105350893 [Fragaria vesca subsp. vesca]
MKSDLLPGQRFCPMEDELLIFYLEPKVNGKKVPGNEDVICELDLYGDEDPWKIWERFGREKANDLRRNKDLYFFTQKKKKTARSSRASRTVGNGGTWKGQNRGRKVFLLDQNQKPTSTVLGSKKTYTYKNEGSVHHGRWIMYEYVLDESQIQNKKVNKNEYVLCLLRKNDVLPEKKRKRQAEEEDEMIEDSVKDDDGDNNYSEPVNEAPQEKRQRLLPSVEDEQERFLVGDQEFLQPEPSLEYGQEAVPPSLEGESLCFQMDENMGLQTPPMLDEAELQQLFNEEFLPGGQIPLEEEPLDAMQEFESCGQQQLVAEPEPQPREEDLGQQCQQVPTFSANEIAGGIGFSQDENMVQQMGAEPLGGNWGDAIDGESWSKSFMEDLVNYEPPPTMEVGDSNAFYSDFGY